MNKALNSTEMKSNDLYTKLRGIESEENISYKNNVRKKVGWLREDINGGDMKREEAISEVENHIGNLEEELKNLDPSYVISEEMQQNDFF